MEKLCFGVDVGGTSIKLGMFTQKGELVDKWEIKTRTIDNGKHILDDIVMSLEEKMKERAIHKSNVLGVGVGVPGPVTDDGTVLFCVNLGWEKVNLPKELDQRIQLPVKAANDANVAALGEMWQGGGRGYESLVMVTLGTGVGGGIIINSEILAGSNGAAGEIGHSFVVYDETEYCNCGKKGCLEQVASATGVVKEAKKMLESSDKSSVLRELEKITAKDIFDAMKDGDQLATLVVDKLGQYLGIALSQIATVADPQAFVIGGGVSKAGDVLLNVIEKYYNENSMKALKGKKFLLAQLGNDAGIYGAAKMVMGKE